jgi:hypothetical protein
MAAPNAVVEAVGIHGSILLGNAANTVSAIAVRSGSFSPQINVIEKSASTDNGDRNFERGLRSASIRFRPRIDPTAPDTTMPYSVGQTVYFAFKVSGKWNYAGQMLLSTMPDEFTVDGDATTDVTGEVKPGWTRTAVNTTVP